MNQSEVDNMSYHTFMLSLGKTKVKQSHEDDTPWLVSSRAIILEIDSSGN